MNELFSPTIVMIMGVALVVIAFSSFIYYAAYAVRSQVFGPTFWRGMSGMGKVAITFDDGPSDRTDELLEILHAEEVKATFFLLGDKVEKFASATRRISEEGHEIGNHSYSHPLLLLSSPSKTRSELKRTQDIIRRESGITPRFARPPYGVRTPFYFRAARELDLITIQWSDAGFDWKPLTAEQIANNVLRTVKAGSIILLHDYGTDQPARQECVGALPLVLKGLRAKGLSVVPLVELIPELLTKESPQEICRG